MRRSRSTGVFELSNGLEVSSPIRLIQRGDIQINSSATSQTATDSR